MTAANDGLISVVSVEMKPAPRKNERQNVPGGSDPLPVLAANTDREINLVTHYAVTVSVRGVTLLRRALISKRKREAYDCGFRIPDTGLQRSIGTTNGHELPRMPHRNTNLFRLCSSIEERIKVRSRKGFR